MPRIRVWRSTVALKIVMGATGLIVVGFVISHVLGNLLVFSGPNALNQYAAALQRHMVLLWAARAILIAAVLIHIAAAAILRRRDLEARPIAYVRMRSQVATLAGLTMRWSGALLAAFIVFHLLHLTTGTLRPAAFVEADVYDNVVGGFRIGWVSALYLVGMVVLALHLYHGIWAAFRTLGASRPSPSPLRRPIGALVTLAVWLGFTIIPLAALMGLLR